MPNVKNQNLLVEYQEMLNGMQSLIVLDYRGMKVSEVEDLRRKARDLGIEYKVVKNRIFKIALASDAALSKLDGFFKDTRAVALSKKDQVATAKLICEIAKKNDKLKVQAGFLDGQVLSASDVLELSKLPSKEQLLAQIAADIQAPAQYIACGINSVMQKIAIAVNAIREQKESQQASA